MKASLFGTEKSENTDRTACKKHIAVQNNIAPKKQFKLIPIFLVETKLPTLNCKSIAKFLKHCSGTQNDTDTCFKE